MKRIFLSAIVLLCSTTAARTFGQSSSASLSGTISDSSDALIPGVTVTAANTATGVVSKALSNETGTYNIPGLLPGVYTVSAELSGFQTQTYTDVRLGNAAQVRLNFVLQVAALNTTVEVNVSADRLLLESTSSVGTVLPEQAVRDLPIVGAMGNDALNLVRTLPGLNLANDLILQANNSKLAGVSAANVQVQRDGVDASAAGRWAAGLQPATIVNPDLVGEIRMILAPVDAEVGHGNSQVQVLTRSGTNQFHGAAVWNIQNSALDPNTWANNRNPGTPTPRSWINNNQYTLSVGGPIVKNKTFFYALWDGFIPRTRTVVNATVLTPCARQGVFRYFDNWSNGNAEQVPTAGAVPRAPVVDFSGNPVPPPTLLPSELNNPNATPHNGILRYASIFGPVINTPAQPDCSDAVVGDAFPNDADRSTWDRYRTQMDPTGYVQKVLDVMPPPNNYEVGDGLNTAGHRWVRSATGRQNRFGFGWEDERKQLNIKIDQNLNATNKLNASWSYERVYADYAGGPWPFRFDGVARRRPQVLTLNFTSTLSPMLVNEARFGMRRTGTNTIHGLAHNEAARAFIPNVDGIPVLPQLGMATGTTTRTSIICVCGGQPNFQTESGSLFNGNIAESTPMYTFADSMSWTKGRHTFKGGAEVRFASSRYSDDVENTNWSTFARAFGGETQYTPIEGVTAANMPGLQGTSTSGNNQALRSLMTLLTGSLSAVNQLYWLGSADRLDRFDDYRDSTQRTREINQREFSVFFKDDWKIHRDLTLNLGLRWDYYGVPWISDGLTASPLGGGDAAFGYSGRGFDSWMQFGPRRAEDTRLIFVGPDSPNPDLRAWNEDYNNFGPAIGFAWQVPWFGAGQTTVRGGYQVSFLSGGGRFATLHTPLGTPPGSSYAASNTGVAGGSLEYLDLTDLPNLVPVAVPVRPMEAIPAYDRVTSLTAIDANYTTPYVQNLTLAVTRNVSTNLTLDVRYIGTLARKLYDSININSSNFLFNGLKEAFDAARMGGESQLLDDMFRGINIAGAGFGPVGTTVGNVFQSGALHLRNAQVGSIRNNLASGNYLALANTLYTLNYSKAAPGNSGLPDLPGLGTVLRFNNFPENFIRANPQFDGVTLLNNSGNTNYHSLQAQATLRPTYGLNLQASYTWSKLLGTSGPTYTNVVDRRGDYTLQAGDRRHNFKANGTFELPIGPNKLLFSGVSGVAARIIEGWQMSWILDIGSGSPANITAQSMLYGNGVPDRVGDFDPKIGHVQWESGAIAGNYFGEAYAKVKDPQCFTIAASLQSLCQLSAIQDSSGNIVLQNPLPGTRGNLGQNVIELPGVWTFDAGIRKGFSVGESKRLHIRMDATNIFNHPQPANPTLDINSSTAFGNIATKTGNRQFQGQVRLEF